MAEYRFEVLEEDVEVISSTLQKLTGLQALDLGNYWPVLMNHAGDIFQALAGSLTELCYNRPRHNSYEDHPGLPQEILGLQMMSGLRKLDLSNSDIDLPSYILLALTSLESLDFYNIDALNFYLPQDWAGYATLTRLRATQVYSSNFAALFGLRRFERLQYLKLKSTINMDELMASKWLHSIVHLDITVWDTCAFWSKCSPKFSFLIDNLLA
jgi:hypothetical protein